MTGIYLTADAVTQLDDAVGAENLVLVVRRVFVLVEESPGGPGGRGADRGAVDDR